MIKDLAALKRLAKWAKENKVKKLKIGDIEIEYSDLSFVEAHELTPEQIVSNLSENNTETLVDTEKDQVDDDLLYWSSNK